MNQLKGLREKVQQANTRLKTTRCEILPAGEYRFTVQTAKFEYDPGRQYDYLYVVMLADGQLTSDRFPITDTMGWKLADFLDSIRLDVEAWSDEKELVGREGNLAAEEQPNGKVFYRYHFCRDS